MMTKNTIKHLEKIQPKAALSLVPLTIAIFLGLFIRIISLFHYNIFDIGPDPDQIRDAFIYMKMWEGDFPLLGATATGGKYGYSLPPLYYYLVFPITILGEHPALQVIPNALFSSLSIVLVAYLSYKLLINVSRKKRLFLSGLAALWYAVCFPEIFINTFGWNPSSIPFFFLSFILLCHAQLTHFARWKFQKNLFSWLIIGILLAILVSLHSTTLFVIPAVFLIFTIWFVWKYRKIKYIFIYPLLSLFSANLALFPYWKLEVARKFINTKSIVQTILGRGDSVQEVGNGFLNKFQSFLLSFYELGDQAYFLGINHLYTILSFLLLSFSMYLCFRKFKGDWHLFLLLNLTWFIFLYAASNYDGEHFFVSYKLLILIMPLIYIIIAMGYSDTQTIIEKVSLMILGGLLAFSIFTNLYYDFQYLNSKIGRYPVASVNAIIKILDTLPDNSTVCYPFKKGNRQTINQYDYINQYLMKNRFNIVQECSSGTYLIHPKYRFNFWFNNRWPLFYTEANPNNLLSQDHKIIMENTALKVIKFQ